MKTVKEIHNSVEHRQRKPHVSAGVQAVAIFPRETCRIILNTTRSQSHCESALCMELKEMGSKGCKGPWPDSKDEKHPPPRPEPSEPFCTLYQSKTSDTKSRPIIFEPSDQAHAKENTDI